MTQEAEANKTSRRDNEVMNCMIVRNCVLEQTNAESKSKEKGNARETGERGDVSR